MTNLLFENAAAWTLGVHEAADEFSVDPSTGLDPTEVVERRRLCGHNLLRSASRRPILSIVVDQFKSMVILLLLGAGLLAFLFSDHAEGLAIFSVIAINATIGFLTEWRAIRSMEALHHLGHVETVVLRGGVVQHLAAEKLVPGDIVIFSGGHIVTADIRLIEAARLQVDESTLTGESLPLGKNTDPLQLETPVMDRSNMVFKGTAITRGAGRGIVVGTGLDTELGRISELVLQAESQQTPLEKRLNVLGERLAGIVVVIAVVIAVAGVAVGRETFLAIEVAIALAVAAIPEGLPIVATIALARGMWRMAKRNALISRLSAVETLGATSVILTDKTGTLTQNRMTVTAFQLAGVDVMIEADGAITTGQSADADLDVSARLNDLLSIGALCGNATLHSMEGGDTHAVGDPMELALLVAASHRGLYKENLLQQMPEIEQVPFDPDTKLMATLHNSDSGVVVAVKGAPEAVLQRCIAQRSVKGDETIGDQQRQDWLDRTRRLGERGLRTLAIARKTTTNEAENPYADLVLLGIVGLEDPARPGVKTAVSRCREAGIRVVMVTGDHSATARNIAAAVGVVDCTAESHNFVNGHELDPLLESANPNALLDARVFSRASPEQKLALIDFYQQQGFVVAMTGDGVNDAPALKKADIGIAMGIRGTAVAREASHMVLQDDEFGSIVEAVAQGRAIYENIRKFVVYLLSCNISEVLVVTLATVAGAPLPLLPLQILFLNLVTDIFPALALGVGEGSPSLMQRRPRAADEPLLTRFHWIRIGMHGALISVAVLGAMAIAILHLHLDTERAVTVSFCTLALAQLWHVFNMRDNIRNPIFNEITRNVWIWIAMLICLVLIFAAIYLPPVSSLLGLTDPGVAGWMVILPMSLVPLILAPLVRRLALVSRHK